ncbi:DUF421 domain-containing protein [Bacillus carboniphilus]|uniref:DUF421 domain-containing protein n=1 Tax=Bacillus carboniphilus TaxID=86663 RepID=A0ABY9JUC4_9BACI|nr:DUF421 domain-containing protein [Bacillus carboniphilus]WLR42972.1 DUF421 domain-containing protein [Bacillus carboniphilus]
MLTAIIRSICIIVGLFFIAKLFGKKQLSKLSFFEYLVGITVGDIAGALSLDMDLDLKSGVATIIIWAMVPIVISYGSIKSQRFHNFIEGQPTVFIENGVIDENNLRKEKYTADELLEQLRKKSIFSFAEVQYAILETTGELSVLLKKEHHPVTIKDLNIPFSNTPEPKTIIIDGEIKENILQEIGLSKRWIQEAIRRYEKRTEDVFIAEIDHQGRLSVDFFNNSTTSKKEYFSKTFREKSTYYDK